MIYRIVFVNNHELEVDVDRLVTGDDQVVRLYRGKQQVLYMPMRNLLYVQPMGETEEANSTQEDKQSEAQNVVGKA